MTSAARRNFVYPQPTPEDVQLLLQIGGLGDAIYAAYKGDAQDLLAFLDSDLPLTNLEPYRAVLRDLIERRVQRKPRGQRGAAVPTAAGDMEQYLIALCRSELSRIRAHCGGRVPPGGIDLVIKHWGDRLAGEGAFIGLKINGDRIKEALRRPSRARTR